MTALHTAPEPETARPRGSDRLLAAWRLPADDPLDALAAALAGVAAGHDAGGEHWSRMLQRHGGRPVRPRAVTDGVPVLVIGGGHDA